MTFQCFICSKNTNVDAEQSVAICDCNPLLTYHELCLQTHFLAGNDTCKKCNIKYRLAVRTQVVFSTRRLVFLATIVGKFLFTMPLIAIILFAVAPADWIYLFQSQKSPYTQLVLSTTKSSLLLFPPKDALIVDVMYMVSAYAGPVIAFLGSAGYTFPWVSLMWQQRRSFCVSALVFTVCFLSVEIVFHMLGALHFLFYYNVGVISRDIFYELRPGWATFFAGPAGLILVGMLILVPLTLLMGIVKFGKDLINNCCCCTVEQRVISLENKK